MTNCIETGSVEPVFSRTAEAHDSTSLRQVFQGVLNLLGATGFVSSASGSVGGSIRRNHVMPKESASRATVAHAVYTTAAESEISRYVTAIDESLTDRQLTAVEARHFLKALKSPVPTIRVEKLPLRSR